MIYTTGQYYSPTSGSYTYITDGPYDYNFETTTSLQSLVSNAICDAICDDSFKIKRVIFNNPATIVMWEDGTKTVVKLHNPKENKYDPAAGLAMCFTKRILGDKFHSTLNKYCKQFIPDEV